MSVVVHREKVEAGAPEGAVSRLRVAPVIAPGPRGGRKIAYLRTDDANAGLYVADPRDPATARRLVACDGFTIDDLAWSPTGDHLAYVIVSGPPRAGARFVGWVSAATPGEIGRVPGMAFAWTARGQALMVADVDAGVLVRKPLIGEEHALAALRDEGDPAIPPRITVSPDGAKIAFTCRRDDEGLSEIWLVTRDSERVASEMLTQIPGSLVHVLPFWSPKGRTLAFLAAHLTQEQSAIIAVPHLEGEGEVLYQSDGVDAAEPPAFSPSAERIAFFHTEPLSQRARRDLALLDARKRELTIIPEAHEMAGTPRFLDARTLVLDGGPTAWAITFADPL